MRRIDLRHLKAEFLGEMGKILAGADAGEAIIFLFEIGDFSAVESALNLALQSGCEITTSLKFNQADWTLTVKKAKR